MALLRLFRGTFRKPPRPCARPHGTSSAGGLVVWHVPSTVKAVSDIRSRREAVLGRSRTFAPRAPSAPSTRPRQRECARVRGRVSTAQRSQPSQYSMWTMSDGQKAAVARVWVTRPRFRHPVTGRLRRVSKEGTRAHGARVRRRAEPSVGRFYVIWVRTVPRVPRGRSGIDL
jgi:hypothetical protein